MATIKMFKGDIPPMLKRGEWATNQQAVYLGGDDKGHKMFQSVFNSEVNQSISGFAYCAENRGFTIPVGTPLTKVQELLDNLPRFIKSSNQENYIKLLFENSLDENDDTQIYKYDAETEFVIKDFINYKLIFESESTDLSTPYALLQFKNRGVKIQNSKLNFVRMKFSYNNETTPLDCLFDITNSQLEFSRTRYDILHQKIKYLFSLQDRSVIYLLNRLVITAGSDEYMIDNVFRQLDVTSVSYIKTNSSYRNFSHYAIRKPNYIVETLYGDIRCGDVDIAESYYRNRGGGQLIESIGIHFSDRLSELIKTQNHKINQMSNNDFGRNKNSMGSLMIEFFEQLAKAGFRNVEADSSGITFIGRRNERFLLPFNGRGV